MDRITGRIPPVTIAMPVWPRRSPTVKCLLCRGMGYGAYQSMQQLDITPVVTDEEDIETAVQAYLQGHLQDHPERLH